MKEVLKEVVTISIKFSVEKGRKAKYYHTYYVDSKGQLERYATGTAANNRTTYKNGISLNAGLKVSQTGSAINISWGEVPDADRYEVYAAYCGKKFSKTPTEVITKEDVTKVKIKKIDGKKLNLKKNYKIYVVAYMTVNGRKQRLCKSIVAHIVGQKNTTYTNIKLPV